MEEKKVTIICPGCQTEISIDDALSRQMEEGLRQKAEGEYQKKLEEEKKKLWAIALEKAEERSKAEGEKQKKELIFLKEELESQKKKRAEAEAAELQIRKEKVQLEEDKKTFELEKQRQLDVERAKIREEAFKNFSEEHRLKEMEANKRLQDALKANEELKRKLEQGSQQSQGEVLELELEQTLKTEFPIDQIEPVPKGINGADIIQIIHDQRGRRCGAIAWELKRTKAWTEGWVQKLKDDQRKVKAELAVLVSEVLPSGISEAGFYNGIYVAKPGLALSMAGLLRRQIIEIAGVLALEEGKSEKKDVIYNYLLGPEFRGRIESFIEAAVAMKKSLDQEKRAYTKIWAEREKLIGRIENSMVGLYGEIKGIAGNSLPQIRSLELTSGEEELESVIMEEEIEEIVSTPPERVSQPVDDGVVQQLNF